MGQTLKQVVPSDVAELIVVRHGETTWNANGLLQGQAESDLSEMGVKQAAAVAERLAKKIRHISALYTSDLRRAVDTAQVIADKCGCSKIIKLESLRERHLGKLQGLTRVEAHLREPVALQASTALSNDLPIPGGGESLSQLYARSKAVIEGIAQAHFGTLFYF